MSVLKKMVRVLHLNVQIVMDLGDQGYLDKHIKSAIYLVAESQDDLVQDYNELFTAELGCDHGYELNHYGLTEYYLKYFDNVKCALT